MSDNNYDKVSMSDVVAIAKRFSSTGSGDMLKSVYDPANKQAQILTVNDNLTISNVTPSTQVNLQGYIDNEWTSGDLNQGDVVVVTGGATSETYMLAINDGALVGDYIHLTSSNTDEISNASTVEGLTTSDTLENLQLLDRNKNFGVVIPPTLTDNLNGTVTIGADGVINFSKVANASENFYRINVVDNPTLVLTDNTANFLYCDYNGGNPVYAITLNSNIFFEDSRNVPVYRIVREGNELHILDYNTYGIGASNKIIYKDILLNSFQRQDGLILSTNATRISTVSAGSAWFSTKRYILNENVAGTSGELYEYYLTSGVWNQSLVAEYDSTYYSDGTNRQTLQANRYVAKYFYRGVEDDNHVYYTHGNQYNSIADAIAESVPSPPVVVSSHSIYVGKIVIQQGATNGEAYPRDWGGLTSSSLVTSHEDLSNVNQAGVGVLNGHISDGAQTIAGNKTFTGSIQTIDSGALGAYRVMSNDSTTVASLLGYANTFGGFLNLRDQSNNLNLRLSAYDDNYIMNNVSIGTTNTEISYKSGTIPSKTTISSNDVFNSSFSLMKHGTYANYMLMSRSRGAEGSEAIVQDNDILGEIVFSGYDGVDYGGGARISAKVDGTPSENDMPTRLEFHTVPTGSDSEQLRMTISENGNVGIGTSSPDGVLDTTPDTITTSSYSYGTRVTTTQMNALVGMTSGSTVFNLTTESYFVYNEGVSAWVEL